ncbi:MAG: hypothetical protein HY067_22905 [Betaproteobacteria bacterium]|nr:hypothetical protein [Betaproteobacteria bacterium]
MKSLTFIWILWPSFIVAALANAVFFTVFDPQELIAFGEPIAGSRTAIYSIGFFAFWAVTAASNAMSGFLRRTSAEVNQCPLEPTQRSAGCPKREEGGCG